MNMPPFPSAPQMIVDLDAVRANYALMAKCAHGASTGAAIKANCYGLGVDKIAPVLARAGCTSFFCANLAEALKARQILGGSAEIFVLNGVNIGEAPVLLADKLIPVLSTQEQIMHWRTAAPNMPCALHIDTGMNRLGVDWYSFTADITADITAEAGRGLNLTLLMSHLACADTPENPLNKLQLQRFNTILAAFPGVRASLANSAGILLGEDFHFDLCRPGIALYGGAPACANNPPLSPVVHLEVPVLQVRTVKSGDSIGYGASFIAAHDMTVATAEIGYADGWPQKGFGCLHGQRVPILGRVSMDYTVFDVSSLPEPPKVGDMVSLLGKDLEALAFASGTLSYTLLTGLGPRLVRKYKGHGP